MSQPQASPPDARAYGITTEGIHVIGLALCVAVFVSLRLPWVGHLLVWDEAMNLCTVRSYVSGVQDFFSNWLWRHPPLYSLLMSLLHPLQPGFAERVELMAIVIGTLNLLILYRINRQIFGAGTALWAAFILATMPGAVFFDVWVKTDHPVTLFGLLSLMLLMGNRPVYSGLCLGLAFLFKETALFYAMAAVLLWAFKVTGQRRALDLVAIVLSPLIIGAWWYLGPARVAGSGSLFSGGGLLEHIRFAAGHDSGWVNPWHYYAGQLLGDLGIPGSLFLLGGLVALIAQAAFCAKTAQLQADAEAHGKCLRALWPVLVALPSLILLSALQGKVPWIIIVLFPALATIEGLALSSGLSLVSRSLTPCRPTSSRMPAAAYAILALGVVALSVAQVHRRDYEAVLKKVDAGQWRGASASREAAQTMNRLVKDGDRILMTSFHYWKGLDPGDPCAVFSYYFERNAEVLLRPYQSTFPELVEDIRRFNLDWAVLSPEPGTAEQDVFGGFIDKLGLCPTATGKAYIFHTAGLTLPPVPDSP